MCLTWSEAVTGLAKPQRDDPSLAQQGSMCSLLQTTLSLLLCAPLSCLRRILLCVILCRAFVKHSEPLPLVFSFVFSLPLSFTVSLPVFLVTIFSCFSSFPWNALLHSEYLPFFTNCSLFVFFLFTFLSINSCLFLVISMHTYLYLSMCQVLLTDLQEGQRCTAKSGVLVIKTSRNSCLRRIPKIWKPLSRDRRLQFAFASIPSPELQLRNGRIHWWVDAGKGVFALFK